MERDPADRNGAGSEPELTDQAIAVLVLIALRGPSTAYDVKRALAHLTAEYWSVPHTQVYRECEKLADVGLVGSRQEAEGRRRRVYSLTRDGRTYVRRWVRTPTDRSMEIRDISQLKLLASELSTQADIRALAREQVATYRRRIALLDQTESRFAGRPELELRTINIAMGRAVYQAALDYWTELEKNPPDVTAWRRRRKND